MTTISELCPENRIHTVRVAFKIPRLYSSFLTDLSPNTYMGSRWCLSPGCLGNCKWIFAHVEVLNGEGVEKFPPQMWSFSQRDRQRHLVGAVSEISGQLLV